MSGDLAPMSPQSSLNGKEATRGRYDYSLSIDRVVEIRNSLLKTGDALQPSNPITLRGVNLVRGTPSNVDFGVAASYCESAVRSSLSRMMLCFGARALIPLYSTAVDRGLWFP